MAKRERILQGAVLAAALALGSGNWAESAGHCARDAMLVFDGSSSMADLGFGAEGPTRIEEAREAVAQVLPDVAPVRRIGLMVYGPGTTFMCRRISLKLLPQDNASDAVMAEIDAMQPSGLTPLTLAVEKAAEVLEYRTKPGIVVLVTDGSETCGGAPCALGQRLAAQGRDLTVHVIGFRLVFDPFSWNGKDEFARVAGEVQCLAEATGGTYVATETVMSCLRLCAGLWAVRLLVECRALNRRNKTAFTVYVQPIVERSSAISRLGR